jgi:DNA processing protein
MSEQKHKLWLNSIKGLSIIKKTKLCEKAHGATNLYHTSEKELRSYGFLKDAEVDAIIKAKESLDPDYLYYELHEKDISFVSIEDENYPDRLKNIYEKPYGLYYTGALPKKSRRMTALIGARRCSAYGSSEAFEIAYILSKAGIGIISGMARGIDSASHRGCLEADGYTCAVLGSGIDVCYPPENKELYELIKNKGCIISEFPPGSQPVAKHFPLRNRIISGLSDSVIVVEAREKSGSLITAELALQQNRDVYAVPGRINDPMSYGTNKLIECGAGIIVSTSRLLENITKDSDMPKIELDLEKKLPSLSREEQMIYDLIDYYSTSAETLLTESGLEYGQLLQILFSLSEAGLIKKTGQLNYVKAY